MVFANLSGQDKVAFFELLDEYFASRQGLITTVTTAPSTPPTPTPSFPTPSPPTGSSTSALASRFQGLSPSSGGGGAQQDPGAADVQRRVHGAFAAHPAATASVISAGLRHGLPRNSAAGAIMSNSRVSGAIGKFAAASLASDNKSRDGGEERSGGMPPPPAPPRRTSSNTGSELAPPPAREVPAHKPPPAAPKPMIKRFGDVDTSSLKGMYSSLRNATPNKSAVPPPPVLPPSFPPRKNTFEPPPTRRVPAEAAAPSPPAADSPSPPPPPPPRVAVEQEPQGEWAEVLYDYAGEEPGDLSLEASQRVFITERTSEEWWTGEADGKTGLFPASYVRLL